MSFFWRYVSFLMSSYFYIFFFCFIIWYFFSRFFWNTCYFISNSIPIKSPLDSAVFWCSFWSGFYCICCRFFSTIKSFWPYFLLKLLPMFLGKGKNPFSFTYISRFNWISDFYNLDLITIVKSILSSISNGLLFWFVNRTLISLYSELNACKKIWFVGEKIKN